MKKRLLALIMVLSLALSLVPVGAAAPIDSGSEDNGATGSARQIQDKGGTTYYKADGTKAESGTLGKDGVVVEMSKTIQGTNTENEFDVTLQVKTNQKVTEISTESPDAAVVLVLDVSNSMDDCVNCGKEKDDVAHTGSEKTVYYCYDGGTYEPGRRGICRNCERSQWYHREQVEVTEPTCLNYSSRLEAAQTAALDFLSQFATETGDSGDRLVSIVAFGSNAETQVTWVNVRTKEGMTAAQNAINNVQIGNNGVFGSDGGGTNIEGGLMLARNLLQQQRQNDVSYLYTVLLTDGCPTYHVEDDRSSIESISGEYGGGSYATPADVRDVDDVIDDIQALSSLSYVYSICFGDGVFDTKLRPDNSKDSDWFGTDVTKNTTIGEWLDDISDDALNGGGDLDSLLESFEDVISQIILAAQAWKVSDSMGDNISYVGYIGGSGSDSNNKSFDDATGILTWDILNSRPSGIEGSENNLTLTYTLTYKVKLNNLEKNLGDVIDVNKDATLKYIVADEETGDWITSGDNALKTGTFAVPKVKSLYDNLTFTKQGSDGQLLQGAVFELACDGWSETATSDADGTVTFSNIPSGHTYTLTETVVPEGYTGVDPIPVTVSYGKASATVDGEDLNDGVLINNANTGSLTISKAVTADTGLTAPDKEFTFTVNFNGDATLSGEFDYTKNNDGSAGKISDGGALTLKAGQTATITGIPVGTAYTVTETDPGNGFTSTATGANGTITAGGATAAFTNNYSASSTTLNGDDANGKLLVKKEIDGRYWQESDSFTFTLTGQKDAPMPSGATDDTVTVTIDASDAPNYTADFGDITYTAPGTYTYTVTENGQSNNGLTYDSTVYTVAVTVEDNHQGALYVKDVTYKAGDAAYTEYTTNGGMLFTNTYTAESCTLDGSADLKVSKVLEGRDWKEDGDEFTFTISPKTENAPMPKDENGAEQTEIKVNSTTPANSFGNITFTEAGEYVYTIQETKGNLDGMTYSDAVYTVTVNVTDGNQGKLTAEVTYTKVGEEGFAYGENGMTFTNTFTPATLGGEGAEDAITITKNLTGRAWQEGDVFEFTIEGDENTQNAIEAGTVELPGTLTISHSSTNVEEGLVASFFQNIADFFTGNDTVSYEKTGNFGTITFNEAGTYTFLIKETAGSNEDISYDDSTYKVSVTVTKDKETNALTADISSIEKANSESETGWDPASSIVFTNAATASENTKSVQTIGDDNQVIDADGSIAGVGDILTYTIHWVNNAANDEGEMAPAKVTITDTIPTGTEYVANSATGENATIAYDNSNRTITWTINAGAGDEGNVTFKVKVTDQAVENDGNLITNTAQIQVGDNKYDVKADTDTYVPEKDVTSYTEGDVAKEGSPDSIGVGDSLTYTISYKNTENEAAAITITDVVPEGTQLVSATPENTEGVTITYLDKDGNATTELEKVAQVKWEISDVASGTEGTVTMTVKVVSAWKDNVTNNASIQVGENNPTVTTNTETTKIDEADRTITITPADITVYTGGDGYDGVTNNDEGIVIESNTGLPEPGYYITLPDWLNEELNVGDDALNDDSGVTDLSEILKFFYHDEENDRTWEIERYYPDRESGTSYEVVTVDGVERGRYIYRIKPAVVNGEDIPVRVQFTPQDTPNADPILNDDFTLDLDTLYQEYDMTIYPGLLDRDSIQAQVHEDDSQPARNFIVSVGEATLTVRGTTNGEVTAPVVTDESAVSQNKETIDDDTESTITAVASEDTQYYVNDSMVSVDAGDVHLLADEVVGGNNAEEAQNILKKHIVDNDIAGEDANYVYQYLDLVDNTNGNAWVTATEDVNVYWKLPAGTDANDNFQIVHFNGLNRNYDGNNTAELIDTTGYEVETYTMDNSNSDLDLEIVDVGGEKYLKFATDSFSPFVLVYDSNDQANPTVEKTLSLVNGSAYNSGSVSVGDELTYTITVTNTGNLPLSDVTVTDTFSGVGDLTYAPSTEYSVNGDTITIPNLGVGKTVTISATYTVQRGDAGKDLTNAAAVKLPGDETPTDEDKTETPVDPITPIRPPVDPDKPELNTEDHYAYIVGYPDGNVKPEGNITRAEVATIFFRLLTDESRDEFWSQTNPYSDVSEDDWYNNAVSTLTNAGIIDGYEDGTFKPNGNITRAEFATIAVRFFEATYEGENLFPDIDGHWAQDYINEAANAGIVDGYPDGTFGPQKLITRAEAMTMVNRTIDRHPHEDHLLADMIVWPDNPETAWYYEQVQEATNSHEYTMNTDDEQNPYEIWTELLPVRDWAQLEKEWSDAHSGQSGGDVV